MNRTSRRTQLAAVVTAGLAASIAAASGIAPAQATPVDELTAAKAVSARFHSTAQAHRAGYRPTPECVASPAGTMGVHWENAALMADPEVDPLHPEILLYAPGPGGRAELVGVEYWRAASDSPVAPTLFGHRFDGPMPGHHPAMPVHYDLHVWVWADNPSGMFTPFNPTISCQES